jgi:sugar phosphate isomerase/epimerase
VASDTWPPYTGLVTASLSTMWAQQERFADIQRFRETAAEFGYTAIEASHSTPESALKALAAGGVLSSLHAPAPKRPLADGRTNGDANLASIDETQRAVAIAETLRTIDIAADAGLPFVVVHLGGVGDRRCELEDDLHRLYESGIRQGPAWDAARDALCRWRLDNRQAWYDAAKRSLDALAEHASRRGVALGLESRLNYNEFPHPSEALELLALYPPDLVGFWYDTGHCEVQARLGMIDRDVWFPALTDRVLGCHLHDVAGILDHRAPGNGTLDWGRVAAAIPPTALRVLEINQFEPDNLVSGAIDFLRFHGVIPLLHGS